MNKKYLMMDFFAGTIKVKFYFIYSYVINICIILDKHDNCVLQEFDEVYLNDMQEP